EIPSDRVKMADFDRVKTIDVLNEASPADGAAQDIEGVGREGQQGVAALSLQCGEISEGAQRRGFWFCDIEQHHVCAFDPALGGGDQQQAQFAGTLKNFRLRQDVIVQCDCQRVETEVVRAVHQLDGGMRNEVLGIFARV